MGERLWTPSQKNAILLDGGTVLVSAGAGSGKSSALTERIIHKLSTPGAGQGDISKMLVVTFTKAAASDLRQKISSALEDALLKNPTNAHLSRQLILSGKAKIGTIHSFCLDIIKENFNLCGYSAGVRVAETSELSIIKKELMDSLIEAEYECDDAFADFISLFISGKNDRATESLLRIYEHLVSYPQRISFVGECAAELEASISVPESSKLFSRIIKTAGTAIADLKLRYEKCRALLESDEGAFPKYLPLVYDELNIITLAEKCFESKDYSEAFSVISAAPAPNNPAVKAELLTPLIEYVKTTRKLFKAFAKDGGKPYAALTSGAENLSLTDTAGFLKKLEHILSAFDNAFTERKRKHNILDFSDLERYAHSLLVSNGKPTELALSIADRFTDIYIDEYQDVNRIQDEIFNAISHNNRFMVGDIKQSIYSFRAAVPQIFSDYRSSFPVYKHGYVNPENTIFFAENFRCDKCIIDFTNLVFAKLFTSNSGKVPYFPGDALIYSKKPQADRADKKVELAIVKKGEEEIDGEALYVAGEIVRLVNEEGYRFSDITILLRKTKGSSEKYEAAMKKLGVPFYNDTKRDFFENAEVLLVLCLLNVIDNPHRDIYLAGVLKSPLYGFTSDELVDIRNAESDTSLICALRAYTEMSGSAKGKYFLEKLGEYRKYAEGEPVDKLIRYLYRDTGIFTVVNSNSRDLESSLQRANLMLLYDYARNFEKSSFRGLYKFIEYINDLISEEERTDSASATQEDSDTVRIMTYHHSKGLEFKVCFICGTTSRFNTQDLSESFLMNRSIGMGIRLRDKSGFFRFNTLIREAVKSEIAEDALDEEMRCLYVAMTRAEERLYITASEKDPEKYISGFFPSFGFDCVSDFMHGGITTALEWILKALPELTGDSYYVKTVDNVSASPYRGSINRSTASCHMPSYEECLKTVTERFNSEYKYAALSKIPAKLSVSKLYPGVIDEDEEAPAEATLDGDTDCVEARTPAFLSSAPRAATAAERGTATHIFMQFANFENVEAKGVEYELERLTAERFISAEVKNSVNIAAVKRFFESWLYKKIKGSKKLYREKRFNIFLPASDFTEKPELEAALSGNNILVQGVIDCFFFDSDGKLILVDYKTDYIPKELRADPDAASEMLRRRHRNQLSYYKAACLRLTGENVHRAYIYSFSLNTAIEV